MSILEGFKFKRTHSPIHTLDPRAKFLYVSVMFIITVLFTDLLPLIIVLLIQLVLIIKARILKEWLRSVKGATFLAIFILASTLISQFIYLGRVLTIQDYEYAISLAFRFIVLVTSFSLFFLTTSPDHLGLALEQSGVPYSFCFAFTTAVRFVPVLAEEAKIIMDAQRSRGMELEKGNFIKKVKNYIPILIPLIVNALRRSLELAEAMESRAWGSQNKRTNLYYLELGQWDKILIVFSTLIMIISVYLKILTIEGAVRIPQLLPYIMTFLS